MDLQDCIKFAMENPLCSMATEDGDQPRVRTVMLWKADESGYYFILLSQKDVTKQLKQNPKVELCFFHNAPQPTDWKQMRVTGKIEFLEDEATIEQAYHDRSFLDNFAGFSLKPFVAPCRVSAGSAHFWTLADVAKEPAIPHLAF